MLNIMLFWLTNGLTNEILQLACIVLLSILFTVCYDRNSHMLISYVRLTNGLVCQLKNELTNELKVIGNLDNCPKFQKDLANFEDSNFEKPILLYQNYLLYLRNNFKKKKK